MSRLLKALMFGLALSGPCVAVGANPPAIVLAKPFQEQVDVVRYLVSEKLDGVRAFWDGTQFHTRTGKPIQAPAWFTAALPKRALDGELWIDRGHFEQVSGFVRKIHPVDDEWRQVRYMVFELPDAAGSFESRAAEIQRLSVAANVPWFRAVSQFFPVDRQDLQKRLDDIVGKGGEGLMLHRADAAYETGRSDALLKLKPWQDAEAVVVGHQPGEGKYKGMLGALRVRLIDGRIIDLGSGFSDQQRREPPALGATVTYRYRGTTGSGLPRFATFLRIREE